MFNKKPAISIIIPAYNRAWIIKDAIESVLAQSFDDFELFVVDDGSTDNTQEVLVSYKDKIKIIRQNNRGVSAARNNGILSSNGDYIAFLDSDDIWLPGKLETQFEFLKNNPEALICQTEEIWIKNGKRINPGKRHKKVSGMFFERSLKLCLVSPSAVMMKRSLFDLVGLFDESLLACEDYDLWLRVNHKYPVFLIDTPLVVKRGGHDDQLSNMHSLDKYRIQSIHKLLERNILSNDQQKAAKKIIRKKCHVYVQGCQKRGRMDEAAKYLKLYENF